MSMDEMLLQELYGSQEVQAEEEVKQAQVELVEAVAAEAGVDLNELSDDELQKFAHYVLSDEDEVEHVDHDEYYEDTQEKIAEADLMGRQMAHSYLDELSNLQGDDMYYDDEEYTQEKIAGAMSDVAEAFAMEKIAKEKDNRARNTAIGAGTGAAVLGGGAALARMGARRGISRAEEMASDLSSSARGRYNRAQALRGKIYNRSSKDVAEAQRLAKRFGVDMGDAGAAKKLLRMKDQGLMDRATALSRRNKLRLEGAEGAGRGLIRGAKDRFGSIAGMSNKQLAALAAGGLAVGGGIGYLSSRKKQEKTSALLDAGYEAWALAELYEPEEFAKEAELRAAEILLENGVHPETFEDVYPESVKLASFPEPEDAIDDYEYEELLDYNDLLDEAALHIIDSIVED